MLRTLLAKDLRRARRNPLPWVIQLAVPLVITGIIGLIFSPKSNPGGLGQIDIAFVDQDNTWLTHALQQSMGPEKRGGGLNLKVEALDRGAALARIGANKLAAVVIVPKGFTDDFIALRPTSIELVKNPAEVVHPTIVEEYLATLGTGLNALARTVGPEFATWRQEIEGDDDFDLMTGLLLASDSARRLLPVREFVRPPLVWLRTEEPPAPATGSESKAKPGAGMVFRYVLVGMVAMFLLFTADLAMRDLYRENTARTLARYRTVHHGLIGFVAAKVVFATVMVLVAAVILLGGGALAFQFRWEHLPSLVALTIAYAVFATGFMALFASVAGNERRAGMFNNVVAMFLVIVGGCMFPLEDNAFWRDHIGPWVPTNWFAGTVRHLQEGRVELWLDDVGKLVVVGVLGVILAARIFRRRLEQGVRA